jgi:hypothetical protein
MIERFASVRTYWKRTPRRMPVSKVEITKHHVELLTRIFTSVPYCRLDLLMQYLNENECDGVQHSPFLIYRSKCSEATLWFIDACEFPSG